MAGWARDGGRGANCGDGRGGCGWDPGCILPPVIVVVVVEGEYICLVDRGVDVGERGEIIKCKCRRGKMGGLDQLLQVSFGG